MQHAFSIRVEADKLVVLDQKKLPNQIEFIDVPNSQVGFDVIRNMNVRGAPLISVVALQSLKFEATQKISTFATLPEFFEYLRKTIAFLRESRPTAVNLFNDTDEAFKLLNSIESTAQSKEAVLEQLIQLIDRQKKEYEEAYFQMSSLACDQLLLDTAHKNKEKLNVLTICNTGKLATGGDGTALGLVRELLRRKKLNQLYIPETRPYNQGFRLTAFEAVTDQIPATLIADSMAGYLMATHDIDLVVVGADRVARNGDTANKIGTYTFSVLAKHHNVPFYVILPYSSIDLNCPNGSGIKIEQRKAEELTHLEGIKLAPDGLNAWNPAFDVTPATLISRIFTEKGEYDFKSQH